MVSITEEGSNFGEDGAPGCLKVGMDASVKSINTEDGREDHQCTWRYWEDKDDVYQEFEELDFEALLDEEDTRSIASDDSFYPPDSVSLLSGADSPEPISFFRACCNNNAVIVKVMIRQGVTEEEVRETDRNRRVGAFQLQLAESFHTFCRRAGLS